jgi:fumarate reductase flavoprotein subunit
MSMGVEFRPDQLYASGTYAEMSGVARCHAATGYGMAITNALEGRMQKYEVDVVLRTRVRELQIDDGAVKGVVVDGSRISAGAVVIATGGFGANREFLELYYPAATRFGDESWYIGSTHCQGDGLTLGMAAGAQLGGFDQSQPQFGEDTRTACLVDHAGESPRPAFHERGGRIWHYDRCGERAAWWGMLRYF